MEYRYGGAGRFFSILLLFIFLVGAPAHAELSDESNVKVDAAVAECLRDMELQARRFTTSAPRVEYSPSESLEFERDYRQDLINARGRAQRLFS